MEIDEKAIEMARPKATEGASQTRLSSREKWLSALEKQSFELSDDTLRDPGTSGFQKPPAEFTEGNTPSEPAGVAALRNALGVVGEPRGVAAPAPSLAAAPIPGAFPQASPIAPLPAGGAGAASGTRAGGMPLQSGIAPAPPGHSQRYEALMSQTRFMEVNIQLTQSGGSVTLWIRDFKNKYANEVFHWTRSLETLLRERGQSLSRIMLNGKPIPSIEAVFGGEHGN